MVKTDEHMERVRQRLLDERAGIKASEEAKRQRELKKFGKKVQVERQLERQKNKRELQDKVAALRAKRGDATGGGKGGDDGADDPFDVQLEDALEGGAGAGAGEKRRKMGKGKDGRPRMPRAKRDDKYGFGGKKRHAKSNTRESTDSFGSGAERGGNKKRKISGTAGFRKPAAAKKSRPGKSKRQR